jgi:Xaa-Pro aminopeptidase
MEQLELDAVVSTNPANVRYLTGFKGEPRTLLITANELLLVTHLRTLPWAEAQTKALDPHLEIQTSTKPAELISNRLSNHSFKIGIDAGTSHAALQGWRETLAPHTIDPHTVIEHVRQIKSPAEVALMEKSQRLNEAILAAVLPQIRPHMNERGVQGLILSEMAKQEAIDAYSFTPIVATGPSCWEIHHLPDHTVIGNNQMLLIDLGVMHQGYASDMTRTVCLGKASDEMKEIHSLVGAALEAAIEGAVPGRSNREIDRIARGIISEAGHGEVFTHGLGHQIGLETHDPAPPLSQGAPEISLESGMVFTIEPGVYHKEQFGVRTEDVIVITDGRPRNLTRPSHELLELSL